MKLRSIHLKGQIREQKIKYVKPSAKAQWPEIDSTSALIKEDDGSDK